MKAKTLLRLEFKEAMVLLIVFLLLGIVLAQPSLPHQLYGQINCQNGLAVPDGLVIDLKDSTNTLIKSTSSSGGIYGYNPIFLVWDLPTNELVNIYVSNQLISQINYLPGELSNVNLIVPDSFCAASNPPGSSNSGGSSGGGSSGGAYGGISNIGNSIQDSLNQIKNNGNNSTNNGNNSNNSLNPPPNILTALSPAKMNRYVALNISLFTLIIMGLITFITFRRLRRKEESKSI